VGLGVPGQTRAFQTMTQRQRETYGATTHDFYLLGDAGRTAGECTALGADGVWGGCREPLDDGEGADGEDAVRFTCNSMTSPWPNPSALVTDAVRQDYERMNLTALSTDRRYQYVQVSLSVGRPGHPTRVHTFIHRLCRSADGSGGDSWHQIVRRGARARREEAVRRYEAQQANAEILRRSEEANRRRDAQLREQLRNDKRVQARARSEEDAKAKEEREARRMRAATAAAKARGDAVRAKEAEVRAARAAAAREQQQQPLEDAQADPPRHVRPPVPRFRHPASKHDGVPEYTQWYYSMQDRMRGNGRYGTAIGGVPWGSGLGSRW